MKDGRVKIHKELERGFMIKDRSRKELDIV